MGLYAPELTRQPDGEFGVVEWPINWRLMNDVC
jgi:hypothetical protein